MAFDLLGHKRPQLILKRAIQKQRLSHAYLFYGPEGVGKFTFALAFAQALQCWEAKGEPCQICSGCQKVKNGLHPDVLLLRPPEGKLVIPVEAIREAQEFLCYAPLEGKRRVVLIDEAHRMSEEGANAFLKTLEEPPEHGLVVLITPLISALLPTIVSRCQRLAFSPIPEEELRRYFQDRGAEEAALLVRLSFGSLGRLHRLHSTSWQRLREGLWQVLCQYSHSSTGQLALQLQHLLEEAAQEEDRGQRKGLLHLLEIWQTLLRDLALLSSGLESPLFHEDLRQELIQLLPHWPIEKILHLWDQSQEWRHSVERQNVTPALILDLWAKGANRP